MLEFVVALIVDESKWLTLSMASAALAVACLLSRHRRSEQPARRRILVAMNLFFGVTIGTMAFGHLLAVSTKLLLRTLEGPVALFYLIGAALAVPAWGLIYRSRTVEAPEDGDRSTLALNIWLVATLLALGLHNFPLAAPGILNVGYHLHSRRAIGWALVGAAVCVNVGLLIGSLIFLASGQSFEQFDAAR
jgi:hypothetical protein